MALTKTGLTFVNGQAPALNGANMNAIVDLTDDIVDAIEAPSYSDEVEETKEIISLPSTVVESQFNATVNGNTVVNLLDDDVAGCESTTGWTDSGASVGTDSSNEFEGTNCLKVTLSGASGSLFRDILSELDTSKYYLITAHVKNGNLSGTGIRMRVNCVGDVGNVSASYSTSTTYVRQGVVIQPTDFDTATNVYLLFDLAGSNTEYAFVDAIQPQEISASEYALGATALLEQKAYHRGTKSTDKSRVLSVGKNLFDRDEFLRKYTKSNASLTINNDSISMDATGAYARIFTMSFKVKRNTNYTITTDGFGNQYRVIGIYKNLAGGIIASYALGITRSILTRTFNTGDTNVIYIWFYITTTGSSGNITIYNLQLEEGSTATTYEPYTKTQATCPVKLRNNGTVYDEWNCNTGEITIRVDETDDSTLATPIIIYTQPAILNAESNGTVYVEPYVAEDETAQFYSSGLVLDSNYPLASLNDIDEVNKYNLVDGTITPVDISDLTLASSTSITISSASDGEFYALSYNYRNLSTIGTVTHNHGLNIKAQANDATEGLKLLDKKINDTKINIEQLNDKIEDLYINQIYGTRW